MLGPAQQNQSSLMTVETYWVAMCSIPALILKGRPTLRGERHFLRREFPQPIRFVCFLLAMAETVLALRLIASLRYLVTLAAASVIFQAR